MLERALVVNDTDGFISEVIVRHEPTGKIGAASMILPHGSLDLGFSRQPMHARHAIVTWKDHQGQSRQAEVDIPQKSEGETNILVYTILPASNVHVRLENSKR